MNYKLTLNSSTYFSKLNATNNLSITYAIDWTFLPKDKSFLVSFRFITNRYNFGTTPANNRQFLVNANLGQSNNYTGNAILYKMQNNIIGGLKFIKHHQEPPMVLIQIWYIKQIYTLIVHFILIEDQQIIF